MENFPHKKIGKFIKKARLKQKLKLTDLAYVCGCKIPFIFNIERGKVAVPWHMTEPLAKLLKIDLVQLHFENLCSKVSLKVHRKIKTKRKALLASLKLKKLLRQHSEISAEKNKTRVMQAARKALQAEKEALLRESRHYLS